MLKREEYNIKLEEDRKKQAVEIAEYLKDFIKLNGEMRNAPIVSAPNKETIKKIEQMEIPAKGRDPKIVGDEIVHDILSNSMSIQHPRFLSLVTSAVSPYSLAGAILSDIYNPNMAGFSTAEGAYLIEEKLIKWMGSLAGYNDKCGGLFTSGGSMSNLTGMIAARDNKLPNRENLANAVAYTSDQAHSSVKKGMRLMGLRPDQIKIIDTDDEFKIRLDLLENEIKKDKEKGLIPFLIVGSMGTTNTGSIDDLSSLATLAHKNNMWLHVDGAYGGSILLSDIYRNLAKGLENADSFSWDFHKWAMQTYACSAIIAKDKQTLITAFNEHPEYLEDCRQAEHTDGWDLGIEMSRPARCVKLWYTIQAMGTDLLADVIDYAFYNAKIAKEELEKRENWEIVSKPMCGAINFRYVPKNVDETKLNEFTSEISNRIVKSGYAYVITTELKGKKALRLCLINGNTETSDVINTIEMLDNIANKLEKEYQQKK